MIRVHAIDHIILIFGCILMLAPVALLLWSGLTADAVRSLMAPDLNRPSLWQMLTTSLIIALGVSVVKTVMSILAAYAIAFFRLPFATALMALVLLPLFFPIEARLLPTILVTDALGLLNSFTGLILPITATGLGTLILHGQMRLLTPEMIEAAQLDGAGPGRILVDIVVPLSLPAISALAAFFFVLGWNQYLWPLVASPSVSDRTTLVSGLSLHGIGSPASLALAGVAMLPPLVIFIVAQRWIVHGLAPIKE